MDTALCSNSSSSKTWTNFKSFETKTEKRIGCKTIMCSCCVAMYFVYFTCLCFLIYSFYIAYRNLVTDPYDDTSKRVVCYYTYRKDADNIYNIPRDLCSHVILSFVILNDEGQIDLKNLDGSKTIKRFVAAGREIGVRTMISIGGGGKVLPDFGETIGNDELKERLLKSISEVINETDLDGIDYDWEFPTVLQKNMFSNFLRESRKRLDDLEEKMLKKLDLSVAIAGPPTYALSYSPYALKRYCTFINVMTYDLVLNSPLGHTSLHSALFSQGFFYSLFSVRASIYFWIMYGIPRSKINMGIPTYGVAYTLKNKDQHSLFSPIVGYSKLGANVDYSKICAMCAAHPNNYVWVDQCKVPYFYDDEGNWISYDNERSVRQKAIFATSEGLGGIMIFSLRADDYNGTCGGGIFPLTQTAVEYFKKQNGTNGGTILDGI